MDMVGKDMHNRKNAFHSLIEVFQVGSKKVNIYDINYLNEIVDSTMEIEEYILNCLFFNYIIYRLYMRVFFKWGYRC